MQQKNTQQISRYHWRGQLADELLTRDLSKSTGHKIFYHLVNYETGEEKEQYAKKATQAIRASKTEEEMLQKLGL